jgi:DNA replication protein DnaC
MGEGMERVSRIISRLPEKSLSEDTDPRRTTSARYNEAVTDALKRSGVPKQFMWATYEDFPHLGHPSFGKGGYFLWGPNRTGKSRMAAAMMLANAELGVRWDKVSGVWSALDGAPLQWHRVPRLLTEIRSSWKNDAARSAFGIVEHVCSARFVVLDDIGAEKINDTSASVLYDVIADFVDGERLIVVTSNQTIDEIRGWEPRIASRLENLGVVKMGRVYNET